MSSTTRTELIVIALQQQHLVGIEEAKLQLYDAKARMGIYLTIADAHGKANNYQTVDGFMNHASEYDQAAAKLNTLFMTLASVLEDTDF